MKEKIKYLTLKRKLVRNGTSKSIIIPVEILELTEVDKFGQVEIKIKLK